MMQAEVVVVVAENVSAFSITGVPRTGDNRASVDGEIASANGSIDDGGVVEVENRVDKAEAEVAPVSGPLNNCTSFQADVKPHVLFEDDCMT